MLAGLWLCLICNSAVASTIEIMRGRGIWVNNPAQFDSDKTDFLKEIGVRRVHFMLTDDIAIINNCSSAKAPREIVNKKQLISAIQAADKAGLKIIITLYIPPAKNVIDSMLSENSLIYSAIKDKKISGIEYDLEGKWVRSKSCEFKNHTEAVDYLISKTRSLTPETPVGVTVHYGRLNSPKISANSFDWISAQAYSKCPFTECAEKIKDVSREGKAKAAYEEEVARAWENPSNQPGLMQLKVPARLGDIETLVVIGLPAYSQYWNRNHTISEAMSLAHKATLQLQSEHKNYIGENYWALTNILNKKSNPEIVEFLKATAH